MGRVLFLAGFSAIFLIGNVAGLAAQGHPGTGAGGGNASVGAGGSGSAHAGAMAPARAAGHAVGSPGSHLASTRTGGGRNVARRGSALSGGGRNGTGRNGAGTSVRTRRFRSARGAEADFSGDANGVPGLGFDQVHVAATRGVSRDGRDRGRRFGNDYGVLFPFFDGGGYYMPTGPEASGDVQGDGQDDGQGVEDAEDQGPEREDRPPRRVNREPMEQPGPQPDVPEYVFVRRDGTVFFAVAYTWVDGALRYISSEGARRSVSRDTLDLNATQQFNEQRGMTFRSPA